MKKLIFAILLLSGAISFGQIPTPLEQLAYGTYISWDDPSNQILGQSVSFLEHLPAGSPADPPLVIYLHGSNEKSTTAEWSHGFAAKSDAEGFVVVYLDVDFSTTMPTFHAADPSTWRSVGEWVIDGSNNAFYEKWISKVIEHYVDNHSVDPQRVYLLGQSRGAMLTLDMIPLLSNKVAAFGSYAGNSQVGVIPAYTLPTNGSAPVLMIQGTNDPMVNYSSGGTLSGRTWLDTESSLSELAILNGYPAAIPATPSETIDTDPTDACFVERFVYGDNLELLRIDNGGHGWPGTNFDMPAVDGAISSFFGAPSFESLFGPVCMDISATDEFWDFFSDKTLDCDNIADWLLFSGPSFPTEWDDYIKFVGYIFRMVNNPVEFINISDGCIPPGGWAPEEEEALLNDLQNIYNPHIGEEVQTALQLSLQDIYNTNTGELIIFPNPTQGSVTLDLQGLPTADTQIEVLDLDGRIVFSQNINRSFDDSNSLLEIDLLNVQNGIYLVQVKCGDLTTFKKVVKN